MANSYFDVISGNAGATLKAHLLNASPSYPYVLSQLSLPSWKGYSPSSLLNISRSIDSLNQFCVLNCSVSFTYTGVDQFVQAYGIFIVASIAGEDSLLDLQLFSPLSAGIIKEGTITYPLTLVAWQQPTS